LDRRFCFGQILNRRATKTTIELIDGKLDNNWTAVRTDVGHLGFEELLDQHEHLFLR
jgi:hypothetical protein